MGCGCCAGTCDRCIQMGLRVQPELNLHEVARASTDPWPGAPPPTAAPRAPPPMADPPARAAQTRPDPAARAAASSSKAQSATERWRGGEALAPPPPLQVGSSKARAWLASSPDRRELFKPNPLIPVPPHLLGTFHAPSVFREAAQAQAQGVQAQAAQGGRPPKHHPLRWWPPPKDPPPLPNHPWWREPPSLSDAQRLEAAARAAAQTLPPGTPMDAIAVAWVWMTAYATVFEEMTGVPPLRAPPPRRTRRREPPSSSDDSDHAEARSSTD